MTKRCSKCKEVKEKSEFYRNSIKKDGYMRECKACDSVRKKKRYVKNREVILKQIKGYKEENRDKINADVAKRKARKLRACPDWLTQEQHSAIEQIYSKAQKLTKETGIPYHVDHIVPLKGKSYDLGTKRMRHTISGLHVPWNLQVVSEEENLSKGCRYSEWK